MEILQCHGDRSGAGTDVRAGDLVCVREGVWRVMEVRAFARGHAAAALDTGGLTRTRVLRLIGADALNRWQPCTLLEPFDRPRRVDAVTAPRVVSRARWIRTCAALIGASPPAGCPAAIADAQVTLMPHQIDPVLTVLGGHASRLLLADAVGLGKTIQASLLLRELRTRGCGGRVLILVPSGLRDQWRQELSHRAGLRADIIDAAALVARTRELPPDVNPWSLPGILIVSLDFIKQPSVLHGASAIVWDLLIVDEAHNLAEGTGRLAAADLLARHSRHVVLLTATPHHGSDDAFATLCRIGQLHERRQIDEQGQIQIHEQSHEHGDPIAIFRRTRRTIGLGRTRKVHVLRVTPTKQERWLHALLARYTGRVEREHGSITTGGAAVLAMSVLLKRASSSAASLERSLRRRLVLLDGSALPVPDVPSQPTLPFGNESDECDGCDDDLPDGEPSHVLGAPGLRSARVERAWLTLLIEASRNAARAESKPRALARFLRRCREPALIYTEYRDTLTHLARTLSATSSSAGDQRDQPAMLHGGSSANERRTALARFAAGDARVLLTTDAAGEGLNLHHRCRLIINIEIPWNPNRLEQRIGRVDRLGQTRTVHAIHLVGAGTPEEQMLTRLTGRVARIAATLGDAPDVLRALREEATDAEAGSGDRGDACRTVSPRATTVTAQLQQLRDLRTRAWRIDRRHVTATHASRGDPLLALDQRAPLIAVARRRRHPESRGADTREHDADAVAAEDAHSVRRPLAPELHGPGLLCLWRTRVDRHDNDDGHDNYSQGLSRSSSPVLAVMHIACEIPHFSGREAIATFVTSMLERYRARIQPLLDSEAAIARERLDMAERARVERLARRDDAIALEMAAMLRARAVSSGSCQPLLFEDIAREKTGMTRALEGSRDSWTRESTGALGRGPERKPTTSSLAMVLVLR
jgi:superfamily II DNA or RNA helicase